MTQSQSTQVPPVLVVDFGAQYAQLIARRIREAGLYSEIIAHDAPAVEFAAKNPVAIVLSGGPSSVNDAAAPNFDTEVFDLGIPTMGICYGFQLMSTALGGRVAKTAKREYGSTPVSVSQTGALLAETPENYKVWMSHGDSVAEAPAGFDVLASTPDTPVAAFESAAKRFAGVQWHPEVLHSENGQQILENFLYNVAGLEADWTNESVIDEQVELIRARVGSKKVICGLSGGVDSSVAAALVHKAIGDQLTCVFVDHGLLRQDERVQVEQDYVDSIGVRLVTVDAREQFLSQLAGVTDPEEKRKIIGREFIRTFETAAADLVLEAQEGEGEDIAFLVQGTLYPDVVESGGGSGTANIKSHHNVGGLPDDIQFQLIEPLRALFKDEVRAIGRELGVPEGIVSRQPFPGPGLGIRIIGEVTEERLTTLRRADAIAREELTKAGLDGEIWQCPVVLLADVRSVGVQGDGRTYGHPVVLRPVSSEDAMTADWTRIPYDVLSVISNRITNEVDDINRVVLDVTSKPPGTIEWE
ncbi:glutamine-hydrolyzing GMP synthase [Brevibacterium sp. CFH 10365]|uniref:glutamine-hydrolyzing GMP synthase n=1 Tax=Brevibacterium sp. CFH 10365 TaxID=2585207 RepID=UPI001266260C|nr:glutamine-hydrolyzing GMP synthase [Brevibacterium sp. CFH 10365]